MTSSAGSIGGGDGEADSCGDDGGFTESDYAESEVSEMNVGGWVDNPVAHRKQLCVTYCLLFMVYC
jgi:hypothetical protein